MKYIPDENACFVGFKYLVYPASLYGQCVLYIKKWWLKNKPSTQDKPYVKTLRQDTMLAVARRSRCQRTHTYKQWKTICPPPNIYNKYM